MTSAKSAVGSALLLGLFGTAASDNAPSSTRGKQLYFSTGCVHCHGTQGQGSQAGPRLAPNPPPAAAVAQFIRLTDTNMPVYPAAALNDAAIADIVAYLGTIKPGRDPDRIPALQNPR